MIALAEPGSVHVDYVYLQPGAAGRFGAGPFVKDGVQVLKDMGITSIRLGGSFVSLPKLRVIRRASSAPPALPNFGLSLKLKIDPSCCLSGVAHFAVLFAPYRVTD